MENRDAILFDLDGTLLDTAQDMANATNALLIEKGLPPLTQAQVDQHARFGARGLITAGFGENLSQAAFTDLRMQFLNYYADNVCQYSRLYDEVAALLMDLNDHSVTWGIMTNKPQRLTELILPHIPALQAAQVIVFGDTCARAKPSPEPLLLCANRLNLPPQQFYYVGDVQGDIQAALAANMTPIVAAWSYAEPQLAPSHPECSLTFTRPSQLLSLLR